MNSRKLTKYVILVFTILLADIIKEIVMHYIGFHKNQREPFTSAAIGMGIILVVFYPLFVLMESIMEKIAESYVSNAKKVAGGSTKGLILSFLLGLGLVYCIYLKVWFNINIISVVMK